MIAIITARGGSKRLPNKNILPLNGKPLIAYTIEAALQATSVSRVMVNTDCTSIAEIAEKSGAEIPFIRPHELSTDSAKSFDVLRHHIEWIETIEDKKVTELVLLQPTSPLRNGMHIDEAVALYRKRKADAVISCCKVEHPMSWFKKIDMDGKLDYMFNKDWDDSANVAYLPNGAIYVLKKPIIYSEDLYNKNTFAYIMNRLSSVDIDTAEDFEYASYIMSKNK